MDIQSVELIIPVFNEEKYLEKFVRGLLKEIKNNPLIKRVIFINDGSTDNTFEILDTYCNKNMILHLINLKNNFGKGYAMSKGFNIAKKNNSDCVIFMDSDGQHSPHYIKSFVRELQKEPVVFGYRLLSRKAPWIRKTGNKVVTLIISKLFNTKRRDLLCGFMAFRKDIYKQIIWTSKGYGVEAELATVISKRKIKFGEVFVSTIYLDINKGVNMWHALLILLMIPIWYFKK